MTDYAEAMLDLAYRGKMGSFIDTNEFTTNQSAEVLRNFFRSKDDCLLMLISGLVYATTHCDAVEPALLYQIDMYPFGSFKNKCTGLMFYTENFDHNENKLFTLDSKRDRTEFEDQVINNCRDIKYNGKTIDMILNLL